MAGRGQQPCSNLTGLWANVIGPFKFQAEKNKVYKVQQSDQMTECTRRDAMAQESGQNFKKYLLVDGCNETEWRKIPRIEN